MSKDLSKALESVECTYDQIRQIADDMIGNQLSTANELVKIIQNKVEILTIDEMRDYLLKLQLQAFSLSELRDRAATKASCAEALRKEAYATTYILQEGTAAQKDSNTVLSISENIVTECLYDLVATLCKTKVDELQRLVAVLTTLIMNRMQENKLANMNIAN